MFLFRHIRHFWTGSIRRQLVLGIALVHAVLMTIFVFDLVLRQNDFLNDQSVEQASSLATTLAASSTSWVLSSDVIGLEEVVTAQSGYPNLSYAMVLDTNGKVLGYTDRSQVGKYVSDPISLTLLSSTQPCTILVDTSALIDLAVPILSGNRQIGWARVGIDRTGISANLSTILRDGTFYTLAAILIGTIFALLMGRGLSQSIHHLLEVTQHVRHGDHAVRATLDRSDELGKLATDLNAMLDSLHAAQQESLAQRKRLEGFADNSTDWFWESDETGVLTYVSARNQDSNRIPATKFVGKRLSDFMVQDDRHSAEWERYKEKAKAQKPFRNFIVRLMSPSGEIFYARESGSPIFDDNGVFRGYRGTATEITAEIQREKQLIAAKEAAIVASRSKSEFLANMSHELRTPLNAIMGFSEIIKLQQLGEVGNSRYVEYADDIFASGRLLLEIINDILDLAKVESGEISLDKTDVVLGDNISACIRLVSPRADEARVAVKMDCPSPSPILKADPRLLKQMCLNLMSNAVKFSKPGGTVTVLVQETADNLCITVSDTGIGISEDDLLRIQEPFYQVAQALTRNYEGTGLGLPLVKKLAELHGGSVHIKSKVDEGTDATLCFPKTRSAEQIGSASSSSA